MLKRLAQGCFLLCLLLGFLLGTRAAGPPSVEEAVAGVMKRLRAQLRPHDLYTLSVRRLVSFLTPTERQILSTEHISFRVNVPVTVYIVRAASIRETPFWLRDRDFTEVLVDWKQEKTAFRVWQREFEAGDVGLGVNSLSGGGSHYSVVLAPKFPGDAVILSRIYPGSLGAATLTNGTKIYGDRDNVFATVPERFMGGALLQTRHDQRDDGQIRNRFRWTDHPARATPDQIVLTWSEDPKTTQTIQWRTSDRARRGFVRYAKKADPAASNASRPPPLQLQAKTEPLRAELVLNDVENRRHTATLRGLEPGATYAYTVGDPKTGLWSPPAEFTTAPAEPAPFSFVYMGDAQTGLHRWGALLRESFHSYPDARFFLIAGDLVNRGQERDDWDDFFYYGRSVFDHRTFIPVLGNHDCLGGHPTFYLRFFGLPKNGPPKIEKERAYSFEYGNAFFVILDSNLDPKTQTVWLEQQLAATKATWKFASFHHPAYSSAPERDNTEIRELWNPIFEKHGVDFVLQGHDHAYLRTFPISQGVPSRDKGPIYLVAVSGTKMYDQEHRPYIAFGMTNVPTYQVFHLAGNRLSYRAHDSTGKIRDELTLEKSSNP